MTGSSGADPLPAELEETLATFDANVEELATYLQPLLNTDHAVLQAQLEPADRAKLLLALVYASNSLFWMYLNASGIDPRQHPIKDELERVKSYMAKLKDASSRTTDKNTQKIDKAAANRFLKAALPDASDEVKQKLAEQVKKAEAEQKASKKSTTKSAEDEISKRVTEMVKKSKSADATPQSQKRKADTQTPQTTDKKKKKKI